MPLNVLLSPANGALSPLRHRHFRHVWLANLLSNLGNAMQGYAVLWLIASNTQAAFASALVQTASTCPMLVFALLAGVLSERVERARLQFLINAAMALAAATMAFASLQGVATGSALLLLTFCMGTGATLLWPAWQASVATLLPSEQLPAAASLNNLSVNLAALLGPCVASALLHYLGPASLFACNALSFLGLVLLYRHWSTTGVLATPVASHPGVPWYSAIRALQHQPNFYHFLGLAGGIFFATVALAAVLPTFARVQLQLQAQAFASLMSALGLGAVLSVFVLPSLRARLSQSHLLAGALICFASVLAVLPLATASGAHLLIVLAGAAWAAIITTLNSRVQTYLESRLRAQALAVYMLVLACGQTLGSLAWGLFADRWGVAVAWRTACAVLLVCAAYLLTTERKLLPNRPALVGSGA